MNEFENSMVEEEIEFEVENGEPEEMEANRVFVMNNAGVMLQLNVEDDTEEEVV